MALPDTGRAELKSLTSLRGLAALAVVTQHFSATAQTYCRTTIPSLVPHGYVGVDFFFVLSGFIMAYTYAADFHVRGFGAYRPFLVKRVARIVPLNVVVLSLLGMAGVASVVLTGHNMFFETSRPAYDFAANFLLLQGLGIGTNLNGPSWSISTEFAAYAMFPLFVVLVFGRRRVAWCTVLASTVSLCALATSRPRLGIGFESLPGSLVRCIAEFLLGMAAYRLSRQPAIMALLKGDGSTAGLACLSALCLVERCDLPAVLLLPFLIIALAGNVGFVARLVQWRPFYFLGIVSYSLYLLHNAFRPLELSLLKAVAPSQLTVSPALCFAVAGSLSVIPFAWLAYLLVEQPGRELVHRRLSGRRVLPQAAV